MPTWRAVRSSIAFSSAYLRTSSVIFIEQKCGPHMEQKCDVFAASWGSVSSWKALAVSGSSERLNWSSQRNSNRAFDSTLSRACAPGWPLAGSLDHDLHVVLPGDLGQLAQGLQLGELRLVVCVRDRAWPQPVAQAEGDVVGPHDLTDLFEMRVGEVLFVVGEAPLGVDRAPTRDDAGHAVGRERDVAQPHARVDGEVVHAPLRLLDQGISVDFPRQVFGLAAHLLEGLIDRDGADGHRRVADDPLPRLVDVLARGEVHDRIRAPTRGPDHLLYLLLDRGGDGGVTDVGVDLHQEVTSDDHRLDFRMVDVRRDDRAAAGDLVADELRRDLVRDAGAPRGSGMLAREAAAAAPGPIAVAPVHRGLPLQVLADGDELHLGRDDALAGVVHLGDVVAGLRPQRLSGVREPQGVQPWVG